MTTCQLTSHLTQRAEELADAALKESSSKSYKASFEAWKAFAGLMGLGEWSFLEEQPLSLFVAYLYDTDRLPDTFLAALGHIARRAGKVWVIPPAVALLKKGATNTLKQSRYEEGIWQVGKAPFLPCWLRFLPVGTCKGGGDLVVRQDILAVLLASTAFLRVSSVSHLKWSSIQGDTIFLYGAKNDPSFKGQELRLTSCPGHFWSPKDRLSEWKGLTRGTDDVPVFFDLAHFSKTGERLPLTPARLQESFTRVTALIAAHAPSAISAEMDSDRLTFHSCRYGAATSLFQAGIPVEQVKVLGAWKSDTVNHYLRFASSHAWVPSRESPLGNCFLRYGDPWIDNLAPA